MEHKLALALAPLYSPFPPFCIIHLIQRKGKQKEGADYKKLDQGKLEGGRWVNVEVKGKGPGIKLS